MLVSPQHFYPEVEVNFALDAVGPQNLVEKQSEGHCRIRLLVGHWSEVSRHVFQHILHQKLASEALLVSCVARIEVKIVVGVDSRVVECLLVCCVTSPGYNVR